MNTDIIGIDVGGTKIRAGIIGADGRLKRPSRAIPTCPDMPKKTIVGNLLALVHSFADIGIASGIGVGCTGPLDNDKGMILDANNIPSLNYFNIKECLEGEFGLPTVLENDANAMILGEAMYGAAKGSRSVLGLTLGTGLGCTIVHDGKALSGNTFSAGEIWLAPYRDGTIEEYVSGTAVSNRYREITGNVLPASEVAILARQGNADALGVWNGFAEGLAFALAWCIDLYDPETVVLGGSVAKSADLFLDKAVALLKRHVCTATFNAVSVRTAALGDDGGIIGAAASFLSKAKA